MIYFVGVTLTWLVEMYTEGRQLTVLRDTEKAKKKFDRLDEDVKQCYNEQKILESMKYQSAVFSLRFIKIAYMLIFDFAFIYYQWPLKIWNFLLGWSANRGLCDGNAGANFEFFLTALFMLSVATIETVSFIGFAWIDTFSIRRPWGFSNATPFSFLTSKFLTIVMQVALYLPLVLFGMTIVRIFEDNLVLAFGVGTFFGKFFMIKVYPFLLSIFI